MPGSAKFWFEPMNDVVRVGLDPEFVSTVKGDWLAIELAVAGTFSERGESFGFISTSQGTHDLRAPEAIRICKANEAAVQNPAIVKLSPTGLGWLVEVKLSREIATT